MPALEVVSEEYIEQVASESRSEGEDEEMHTSELQVGEQSMLRPYDGDILQCGWRGMSKGEKSRRCDQRGGQEAGWTMVRNLVYKISGDVQLL